MNLTTTQHISVDLIGNRYKTATVKQNDLATRYINVAVTLNGEAYPLSNDVTCYLRFMPPNGGQPQLQSCRVETDGTVTFEVASSMVTTVGKARANIDIKQTNPADPSTQQLLSTVVFYIIILPSAYGDDVLIASDELSPLEKLIQEAEAGCNNAIQTMETYKENGKYYSENATESAKEAEAWAHGNSFVETETYISEGSATHILEYVPTSITSVEVGGEATTDYTINNKTITFNTAPASGTGVKVVYSVDTSTDNAKYYKEVASDSAMRAKASASESKAYTMGGTFFKVDDLIGDGESSFFTLSAPPNDIISVKINGETIPSNQYTVARGSGIEFYNIVPENGSKIIVYYTHYQSSFDNSKYYWERSYENYRESVSSADQSNAYARGGYFTINEQFWGDGTKTTFELENTPDEIHYIKINDVEVSNYTVSGKLITFTTAPEEYVMIVVSYRADTTTDNAKYYKDQMANYLNGIYHYMGQVNTYADLPTSGQHNGDVYDILTDDPTHDIIAGDNVAWNGTGWDRLSGKIAVMIGATATANGAKGLVPAPMISDRNKFLCGDGTWRSIEALDMVGATSSTDGVHGLVPAPTSIDYQKYLRGDGTWARMYGGLVISAADYQALVDANEDDPNETYFIYDDGALPDGSSYMQKGLDRVTAGKRNGTTLGYYATAEGGGVVASGDYAHAEGEETSATGHGAHSEGTISSASGHSSHVEGRGTIASSYAQHVEGRYNVADANDTYAHITGGGSDGDHRKNIHTLDWNGNAVYEGDVSGKDANNNVISLRGIKSDIQDVYEVMSANGAKNLIELPYTDSSGTVNNGITFTYGNDKVIVANGTATADAEFCINDASWDSETDEQYIFNCEGLNGSENTYYVLVEFINNRGNVFRTYTITGEDTLITVPGNTYVDVKISIHIKSGQTLSSVKFKPMLRLASDTDDTYKTPVKTNKQLTEDVDLISNRVEANTLGDTVSIDTATYNYNNPYVCPADGYLKLAIDENGKGLATIIISVLNSISMGVPGSGSASSPMQFSVFVKKGMKVYLAGSTNSRLSYVPLQY